MGGMGTLSIDGRPAGQARIERTIPFLISFDETLDVGSDTGTAVSRDYDVPARFSGRLQKVVVDLAPREGAAVQAGTGAAR